MQPADLGRFDHVAEERRLNRPADRGIFVEGQMSSGALVVFKIFLQDSAQARLVENDDVVQAFTPHGTNQTFDVGVLPRRLRRDEDFVDAHPLCGLTELRPVRAIAVPQEITRRTVPRERFNELMGRPFGGGMCGDGKMHGTSTIMTQDQKNEQYAERNGWHHEEIDRHQVLYMVLEERAPSLGWRFSISKHVLGDSSL